MNKKLLYLIIVIVVGVLIIGGYFIFGNYGEKTNITQQKTTATTETIETDSVSIKNFSFSPSDIKVKRGTTVTWKNEDTSTHKIKSDTFESGDITTGNTYQFKFEDTGTFNYICSIHPSMKGTVTVE